MEILNAVLRDMIVILWHTRYQKSVCCVMECIGSIEDRNTLFNKLGQIEDECDKQKFIRIMKSSDLNVLISLAKLVKNAMETRKNRI